MRCNSRLAVVLLSCVVSVGCVKGPVPSRVELTPRGALLTPGSPARALTARVFDARGQAITAAVTWSSSAPDVIAVDAAGVVTARGPRGSAVITAQAGDARALALLVAVEPPPGLMLVHDDDVVGEPSLVTPGPLDVGARVRVTLAGVDAPGVGALLASDGEKPVGGRVVAAQGPEVTLELVPLDELFPDLDVAVRLELSPMAVVSDAVAAAFDAERLPDGRTRFTPRESTAQAAQPLGVTRQPVGEGPFSCESTLPGVQLELAQVTFTVQPSMSVDFTWRRTQRTLVVSGQPSLELQATPRLSAAIEGKLTCKAIVFDVPIPAPGPLGLFLGAFLPMGVGFEVGGKVPLAQVGVQLEGRVQGEYRFGFDCQPDCAPVQALEFTTSGSAKPVWPSFPDAKLELTGFGFLFARLEGGARFSSTLRFEAVEAKAGVRFDGTFSTEVLQLDDPDFKGAYALAFEGTVGAARDFDRFLRLLRVTVAGLELRFTRPLARSPEGEAQASRDEFEPGDEVTFDVRLVPETVEFVGVGYNVQQLRLVRRAVSGGWVLVAEVPGAAPATTYSLRWVATESGAVGQDFFALVETGLLPTPRLELARVTPRAPGGASYAYQRTTVYEEIVDGGTRFMHTRTEEREHAALALQLVNTTATTKEFEVLGGSLGYEYAYDYLETKRDAGFGSCHYDDVYEQHETASGSAPASGKLWLAVSDAGVYEIDGAETDLTATGTSTTQYRVRFTGESQACRTPWSESERVERSASLDLEVSGTGARLDAPSLSGSETREEGNRTRITTWTLTMP